MSKPVTCESCGAKFRSNRTRCPRCRSFVVARDPAAAAAKGRTLARVTAALVCVFLAGLAFIWVGGERSAGAVHTGNRQADSGGRSQMREVPVRAVRRDPGIPFLDPAGAASLAYHDGDYQGALARLQDAVQKNPGDAESLSNLAQVLIKLGRTAEALPHLERATALNPDRWAYRFNRARALGLLGRWEESVASYQQAQRLFPDDYVTTFNLGLALQKGGDEAAAVEQYRRAIALNPEDASFHKALAMSYDRLEKRAEAIAAYSEYLRLSPGTPEAEKVRTRIAELNESGPSAQNPIAGGVSNE